MTGRRLCWILFCIVADQLAVLHGSVRHAGTLDFDLKVSSLEPHIQNGNVTLRLECRHKPNCNGTAVDLTITLNLPYYFIYGSTKTLQASIQPSEVTNGSNYLTIKFAKLEPVSEISLDVSYKIDPQKNSKPDKLHTSSAFAQLNYRHVDDSCHDHVTVHATATFDFYTAGCQGFGPMGMSDGRIKESQLSVSSLKKDSDSTTGYGPYQTGLHGQKVWSQATGDPAMDRGQYLQVDFMGTVDIRIVAIQARPNSNASIESLRISYSHNAVQWRYFHGQHLKIAKSKQRTDSESVLIGYFESPVITRYFRITPSDFRRDGSVRTELYGCHVTADEQLSALGLESRVIGDNQMSASSSLDPDHSADKARLNSQLGGGAWCPAVNDNNQFLQVDLGSNHVVHKISTQSKFVGSVGSQHDFVKYFLVEDSTDGSTWKYYKENGENKKFLGNLVEHMVVTHQLLKPITARHVRFLPRSYAGGMCMRAELHGNSLGKELDQPPVHIRSFLVDPDSKQLFVCNAEKPSSSAHCYVTINGKEWAAADLRLLSILGYDKSTQTLYGVSLNRKAYLKCEADSICVAVPASVWRQAREYDTVLLATEIPMIPVTGLDLTEIPLSSLTLKDASGNEWGASSRGIHFKANGNSDWTLVLAWHFYDLDRCVSGPCQNRGACIREQQSYSCECYPGWSGDHCETGIDDCASAPCQNGGTCADAHVDFTCSCKAGYNGKKCEIDINECASNPCQNGGTCNDAVNGYTCSCASGWEGVHCTTDINECASNPCQNGGACSDAVNGYTCSCASGWTGEQCTTDIDECASNPCQNGGTCNDAVNSYTCSCASGWEGVHCATDTDECASNPCQNGGTCNDAVNSYTCSCASGWAGAHCTSNINECSSSPCLNGGTCTDQVNGFLCSCTSDWKGARCGSPVDHCSSYTELSESTRRRSYGGGSNCDNVLDFTKWYRVTGSAGSKLTTSAVATDRCATQATGWLNGAHPTEAEGIVTRQVCYHWSSNTCHWSNTISVKSCGQHYIYKLSNPPCCNCRYCTD